MRQILFYILTSLTFFGCKNNAIEGIKLVHIHVETETHEPIDSIGFYIEKTVPVVFVMVTKNFTDSNGNCTLTFDYNTNHFAMYELKITGNESIITTNEQIENHKIYKLKTKLPELEFWKENIFNVNLTLVPAAKLQIYCSDYSGLSSDKLELKILESDSIIYNNQILIQNLYDKLNIYTTAKKEIKLNYKTLRYGVELKRNSDTLILNDFETKILKLNIE